MLPRRPILLGGVIAPLLWTGLIHSILGIVNPVLNEAYSLDLVCGVAGVVRRCVRVSSFRGRYASARGRSYRFPCAQAWKLAD